MYNKSARNKLSIIGSAISKRHGKACRHVREQAVAAGTAGEAKRWTHRGLNPGPSACKADALPLRYAPATWTLSAYTSHHALFTHTTTIYTPTSCFRCCPSTPITWHSNIAMISQPSMTAMCRTLNLDQPAAVAMHSRREEQG